MEINPPLGKNTENISRGSCKSGKQTSGHARVCLQDFQVPREIFPVFITKGRFIYILHLQKCPFLNLMTSQIDVNDNLTLRHLISFCATLCVLTFERIYLLYGNYHFYHPRKLLKIASK